ncbi:MAG TPA: hypothetical protein VFL64_04540 [Rhizobacter sp.]|nr:hypothetical protein [Rhizobacter sp.]
MSSASSTMNASMLRECLMAPQPMPRFTALHAIEEEVALEPGASPARVALAHAAARFIERGIPYYSAQDPHYRAWVSKAVSYWERLHHRSQ